MALRITYKGPLIRDTGIPGERKCDGVIPAHGNGALREERITSDFGDASHVSWFMSLFDQFRRAIEDHDYCGFETKEAYYCVRLIEKIYESTAAGSKEIAIDPQLEAFN